jgi:hypothetical protein
MKKTLIELIPLFVMAFFTVEMTLIVLVILNAPILLLAYIPIYICIAILIILKRRKKEGE